MSPTNTPISCLCAPQAADGRSWSAWNAEETRCAGHAAHSHRIPMQACLRESRPEKQSSLLQVIGRANGQRQLAVCRKKRCEIDNAGAP